MLQDWNEGQRSNDLAMTFIFFCPSLRMIWRRSKDELMSECDVNTHLSSPQDHTSHITQFYHSHGVWYETGSYQCHIYGLLHTIYHQISQSHRILDWSETMCHITHTVTIATTLVTISATALDDTDTVTWSDWGPIETSSNWRFIKSKSSR